MKSIITLSLCFLITSLSFAQGTSELYALFPEMPTMVKNEDLREIKKQKAIPEDYYATLRHRDIYPIYPIGKLETKKAIVVFYADWTKAINKGEEDLFTVNSIAFNKKSGKEIPGSSMSYLTMSGDDAYYREGDITFNGEEIVFRIQSFERKGGDLKNTSLEVYKLGKKGLDFVVKTTK